MSNKTLDKPSDKSYNIIEDRGLDKKFDFGEITYIMSGQTKRIKL